MRENIDYGDSISLKEMRCGKTMCAHPKCLDCYPQPVALPGSANTTSVTPSVVRTFSTGANRDVDTNKLDYEGFLSSRVLTRYAEYMHKNRFLRDGSMRDSDNWQKGIPLTVYMKSMFRHFMEVWRIHRGVEEGDIEESLCALRFNVDGMLHEILSAKAQERFS